MKRSMILAVVAAGILAGGAVAVAQQPPSLTGGFSVEALVFELSLFMPAGQGLAAAGGRQGGSFRITRDPALFLTVEQMDKILPIMRDLKASPFPTPSRARTIRTGVDAVLSKAQKASWEKARKDLAKARADAQARAGSQSGGLAPGQGPGKGSGQGQGQAAGQGPGQGGGAGNFSNLTPEQRRVRLIDGFIGQLEERRAELGKG